MASNDHHPRVRYQQGEWFGIVRNGTVVFLGPETPHALIDAVWELLASAPEAHEVLHEVTEAFGVSLSRIPPFGIIDSKDGLRVFLRGDLELAVQSPAGEDKLTGRDVTTWTERRIGDGTSYTVRIGDGSISPLDSLPITSGVVLLSSLDVGARDSAGAGAGAGAGAVSAVQPATVPAVVPATPAGQSPASIPVSDETMIGYPETDLGLTIAPGHESSGLETANPETANPDAAELQAVHQETAQQVTAQQEPAQKEPAQQESTQQESADDVQDESARELADESSAGADGEPAAEAALVRGEQEDPAGTPATPAADDSMPASTEDPLVPSLENTTNYDHLWDKTVMRNIEDAAVRLDEESDEHDAPASTASREQPAAPLATPGADHTGDEPPHGSAAVGPVTAVPQAPAAALAPAVTQSTGLIDSVPWLRSSPGAPQEPVGQPSAPSVAPAPQIPAGWRSPPQVSANDSVATDSGANNSVDEDSDHDGQTIMKSSLAVGDDAGAGTSNAATSGTGAASAGVPAGTGPSVLARVCSQGHANPPTYPQCSVCGLAVTGDAVQVPRPRLGRMRISTGDLIDLDQSLIIGRQPSVSRVQGGTMPRLVQVESPGGDISRSHVEVRLEGWHVMLCDLKATNGTVLIREGQAPRRLAQNEMAILLDGDIAELGDDISLRFEEIL